MSEFINSESYSKLRERMKTCDSCNILVVDDNPSIHEDFRKILLSMNNKEAPLSSIEEDLFGDSIEKASPDFNCNIEFASQSEQAILKVKAALSKDNPFQVVFMDVRMPPGADGIKTTQSLWQIDPRLEIVLCTAFSDYDLSEIHDMLGGNEQIVILRKPFDPIEIQQSAFSLSKKWFLRQEVSFYMNNLEEQIDEAKKRIEERKNREFESAKLLALGEMAGGVAHEINNPLATLMRSIELLTALSKNNEKLDGIVQSAQAASSRIENVVQSLITYVGVNSPRKVSKLNADKVLAHLESLTREKLVSEGITLRIFNDSTAIFFAHESDMLQIFVQLISNSVFALKDSTRKEIKIAVSDEKENILFTISDSGPGVPSEITSQIMNPFFTTKPIGSGTGMGLNTVQGITKAHEGEFTLKTNKPATFILRLPIKF